MVEKIFFFKEPSSFVYIDAKSGACQNSSTRIDCYHSKGVWHEGWREVHPKGSHEMGIHCLIFTCFLNGRSSLS